MNMNYSKKEIAIFEGVNDLIEQGVILNNLKVSDIAKAASVGKGTVYEYFSTKEEVITKAVMYNLGIEASKLYENSLKANSFEEKFDSVLDTTIELSNKAYEYMQIFSSNTEFNKTLNEIREDKDMNIQCRDMMMDILKPLILLGIEENIINKELEQDYIKSVFISVIGGVLTIVRFSYEDMNEDYIKNVKSMAHTMLIKSLQ